MAINKDEIPNLTHSQLLEQIQQSMEYPDEYDEVIDSLREELILREPTINYACQKCGHTTFKELEFRAAGGALSAMFDIQTEKYRVITCARCGFSEMYRGKVAFGGQIIDFLTG